MSVVFAYLNSKYGIYYLSNDDTGIMKTYSGYATGMPTAFHEYGSYTLGLFFKGLYTVLPKVNWYSLWYIGVVILANAVIIYSIYETRNRDYRGWLKYADFALICFLTISITMYGIYWISWTITAAVSSVAGVMLLMRFVSSERNKTVFYVMSLVFFFVGQVIRGATYKAVMPFALLAIGCYALSRINRPYLSRDNAKVILFGVLLMIPIVGIYGYGKLDSAWKQEAFPTSETSFEHYRGLYTDSWSIPYEGYEDFYESIGWDEEFYNMTRSWFFIDERFNTENLKKIAEKSAEERQITVEENGRQFFIDEFWEATRDNSARVAMSIGIIVMLILSTCMTIYGVAKKKSWHDWLLMAGAELLAVAECWWLIVVKAHFIDRAFYCAAYPALLIGIYVMTSHFESKGKYKWMMYVPALVLTALCTNISFGQYISSESSESSRLSSQISVDADTIAFNNPENFYISDKSIAGGVNLFLDMNMAGCGRNRMLWGGTGVYSKPFYATIARFGYDEFFSENLFDEGVYYMTTISDIESSKLMAYMRKTYGESVTADLTEKTDNGIYIWDFKQT